MKNVRFRILENKLISETLCETLKKVVVEAIIKIGDFIPVNQVDISIGHSPKNIQSGIISGISEGKHEVVVALNVKHREFKKRIQRELPKVLAHELYHIVAAQKQGIPRTLYEQCIAEGLAIHFEKEVFGGKPPAYSVRFKKSTLQKLIILAEKQFNSDKFSYTDWFHGGNTKKIPRSAGYCIGYYIVKQYIKNNHKLLPSRVLGKKLNITKLLNTKFK